MFFTFVLAVILIALLIIITKLILDNKRISKSSNTGSFNEMIIPEQNTILREKYFSPTDGYEFITLICVKRLKGSGPDGLETNDEVRGRLNRLNRYTFVKQEVSPNEKPYDRYDWENIRGNHDAIEARNKFESEHVFLYDTERYINEKTYPILTKKFKKKN